MNSSASFVRSANVRKVGCTCSTRLPRRMMAASRSRQLRMAASLICFVANSGPLLGSFPNFWLFLTINNEMIFLEILVALPGITFQTTINDFILEY
jgi:hypothetical protein